MATAQVDPTIQLASRLAELALTTEFQAGVLSGLVLLVVGLVGRLFVPKARVIWGTTHQFTFGLPPPQNTQQSGTLLHTRTILVTNEGRAPSGEIEVHLTGAPSHLQLWPPCNHRVEQRDSYVVTIPNLGRKENVSIEMIGGPGPLPDVIRVRTKMGDARFVPVTPTRVAPPWVIAGIWTLLVVGAFALLKVLFEIGLRLWQLTL